MRRTILTSVGLLLAPSICLAQPANAPASVDSTWKQRFQVDATPLIGRSIAQEDNNDLIDDSSLDAFFQTERELSPKANFRIRLGFVLTPSIYDADGVTSALYAQASVGERQFAVSNPDSLAEYATAFPDKLKPYARYRFTRAFDGILDDGVRSDHRMTVGVNYRDVRTVLCPRDAQGNQSGPCTSEGVILEFDAVLNAQWSTEIARNRIYPNVKATIFSPPFEGGMRLYGFVQGELSFFSDSRVIGGSLREDKQVRVHGGLDLSAPAATWLGIQGNTGFEFKLGVQWERQWSNAVDRRYSRGILAPSLTLYRKF